MQTYFRATMTQMCSQQQLHHISDTFARNVISTYRCNYNKKRRRCNGKHTTQHSLPLHHYSGSSVRVLSHIQQISARKNALDAAPAASHRMAAHTIPSSAAKTTAKAPKQMTRTATPRGVNAKSEEERGQPGRKKSRPSDREWRREESAKKRQCAEHVRHGGAGKAGRSGGGGVLKEPVSYGLTRNSSRDGKGSLKLIR